MVPFVQFKNVKNTHGGVLLLVKLQAKSFLAAFRVFKLYKLYQTHNESHKNIYVKITSCPFLMKLIVT